MSQPEPAERLHALGWRQGSVFDVDLPLDAVVLGEDDRYRREQAEHGTWVVASQDCDLANATSDAEEACIELRPVFRIDPPPPWGIRSRRLRLTGNQCILADSSRAMISPRALHVLGIASRRELLEAGRLVALKTWLGMRYDRPAVPDQLVGLARVIAERASDRPGRPTADMVHDLLVQFDTTMGDTRFRLFAVIVDEGDAGGVRAWLGDIGTAVPTELGVMAGYDVGTRSETSLVLLESSYALDMSDLTWRGEEPMGAT